MKFNLKTETLFLTVNILDRYLEIETNTLKANFQLLGIVSMYIACKYEEIYFPDIKEFLDSTENKFNKKEFLSLESNVLSKLNYEIQIASPYLFLSYIFQSIGLNNKQENEKDEEENNKIKYLAEYILELSLLEYKMLKQTSTLKACAAIYLSKKTNKITQAWNEELKNIFNISDGQIKKCAIELIGVINFFNNSQLKSLSKKFSSKQYFNVTKILADYS